MRVEHTYELSSLAKSLKKQLGLTNFTNSQILEVLAKAANAPSYGHMKSASQGKVEQLDRPVEAVATPVLFPAGSEYVKASAWSDDEVIELEFDARPFLYKEDAREVFDAVMSQLFHEGRTEYTDQIHLSVFSETESLSEYLKLIQGAKSRSAPIGFEAEIDAVAALRFLRDYRPSILVWREQDIADYALNVLEIKGELFTSWSQVFGDDCDQVFNQRNLDAAKLLFDALIEYGQGV